METNQTPKEIAQSLVDAYKADLGPYHLAPTEQSAISFTVYYFRQPGRVYPGNLQVREIGKALYTLTATTPQDR